MPRKIIIMAFALVILIIIIFQFASKNGSENFELAVAEKGTVIQEISETGQVIKDDRVVRCSVVGLFNQGQRLFEVILLVGR